MRRKAEGPEQAITSELRERLVTLRELLPSLTTAAAKRTMAELRTIMTEIERTHDSLDPIIDPRSTFDPSVPETAGRLVALALLAQDRVALDRIAKSYGSGVYALYYTGDHPAYAEVTGTETPIYVGKADPESPTASTPRQQGTRLFGRLKDHRKMIRNVSQYATDNDLPHLLRVEDFECRRLVCATNAQLVAEARLIRMFVPIWNKEAKIFWGISKHGDSPATRSNKRSPWDVMHPGRAWATGNALEDKMTPDEITRHIKEHFQKYPPHANRGNLLTGFLEAFKQEVALTSGNADDDAAN